MANETPFGQRLRKVRNEKGLTLVDLASRVGAAEGSIRQLEGGRIAWPNFRLGIRLADALNVDPRWLALGEGESTSEQFDAIRRRLDKIEKRLAAQEGTNRRR